jgi:hypothetical protein
MKMGAVGMWLGLCLALVLIGSALLGVWQAVIKNLNSRDVLPAEVVHPG